MKVYGTRKELVGKVVSNKMEKTAVVAIERMIKEPLYKKYIRKTKKVYAHDSENQAGIGDVVRLVETKPMSKNKRWMVVEIIERAQ